MKIFGGILSATTVVLLLLTGNADAADAARCTLAKVVNGYKEGLLRFNAGEFDKALTAWIPLADAGLGPAQRELAIMYWDGKGVTKSQSEAALWAELAFRSGDTAARKLTRDYRAALSNDARGALDQRLGVWKAAGLHCEGTRPLADVKLAEQPLDFPVEFDRTVVADLQQEARDRLPQYIAAALKDDPMARVYLGVIDSFEFHTGGQYHRFVGWVPKPDTNVMRVATNASGDDSPEYTGRWILQQAQRRVYESLPESTYADPVMRVIGGKKVFGSVYPDINNGNFFTMIRQTFDMVDKLPPQVRPYFDIVDEVYYGPMSKHYRSEGTIDAQGAYYNKVLSAEGHRIIFVRRDVLYSSPLYLLQTFVHEGTHAAQDKKAYQALVEAEHVKRQIKGYVDMGQGTSPDAKKLEAKLAELMDYPTRWYRGIESALSPKGRIQDMAFECEATRSEIYAVRAVGAAPDIMNGSGYIRLCPDEQKMVNQWREDLVKTAKAAK